MITRTCLLQLLKLLLLRHILFNPYVELKLKNSIYFDDYELKIIGRRVRFSHRYLKGWNSEKVQLRQLQSPKRETR
jgi:hypothetical protein